MTKTNRGGRPPGARRQYDFDGNAALMRRLEMGLTQRQVVARCKAICDVEVSDSNLSKYEKGHACPGPPSLRAIARSLDMQISDLIIFREDAGAAA